MGTNASIWIKNDDGSFTGIYNHFDGGKYLSNMLTTYYTDKEKVQKLINLGSCSFVNKEVDAPKEHTFDHPIPGFTVAYHRDRGEDFRQYQYKNVDALKNNFSFKNFSYNYFFINGMWYEDPEGIHSILN